MGQGLKTNVLRVFYFSDCEKIFVQSPPTNKNNFIKTQFANAASPGFILVCAMGLLPLTCSGQLLTWEGDQDGNWNTDNARDTNWSGDVLPVAGDFLTFAGIANPATTNDLLPLTSFSGISFTNDGTVGAQDAAFTLAGNSITLTGNINTTATTAGTLEDPLSSLRMNGGQLDLSGTTQTVSNVIFLFIGVWANFSSSF